MDDSWDEEGTGMMVNQSVAAASTGGGMQQAQSSSDGYNDNYSSGGGGGGGGYNDGGYNDGGYDGPRDVAGFLDNEDGGAPPPEKPKEVYVPEDIDDEKLFDFHITSGINFSKYDAIPVNVTGKDIPPPIKTFDEAGLDARILSNVKRAGYSVPTPIQKNAIPVLQKGRDLMACAQTGSGKTAAFLLPMINTLIKEPRSDDAGYPQAVIVTPTRELCLQIYQEARKFAINTGINVKRIYGGTAAWYQAQDLQNPCDILVATPGRLLDFVKRGNVEFSRVRYVVLDEADRMLDMGFITSMKEIVNHPTMTPKESYQTLMFSATFPKEIQRLAAEFLTDYIFVTIGILGGACSDVTQNFFEVTRKEKRKKLTELLEEVDPQGTLIFVERKADADFLATFMSNTRYSSTSIHGDRLQSQREMALREFKAGERKVLIATSVAARGLDIPNVKHVINYDMPKSIDEYVHRIGRTGRVGNKGRASSFFDPLGDAAIANDLVNILQQAGLEVPSFLGGGGGGGGDYGNGFGGSDMRGCGNEVAAGYNGGGAVPPVAADEEAWD